MQAGLRWRPVGRVCGALSLTLALTLGLVPVAPLQPTPAKADELEQLEAQVTDLESQVAETQGRIDSSRTAELQAELQQVQARLLELNKQAEQAHYDLLAVEAKLAETNAQIDELSAQIEKTKAELAQAREDLSVTMSWSYKARPDFVSLLLSSEDFDQLVSNIHYANSISASQAEQIERVRALKEQEEQQMAQLEVTRNEQQQLADERQALYDEAQAAVDSLNAYSSELSAEVQAAIAADEAARAELSRLQGSLVEARRAVDEEVERQRAEAAASIAGAGTPSASGSVDEMVTRALSVIGAGYVWSGYVWTGDVSTSVFTCSGLVDFALGRPTNSSWPESLYAEVGDRMVYDTSQLNYGDLVFYSYAGRYPGHVGIYIGDGLIVDAIPGGVGINGVNYMPFIGGGPVL